MLGQAQELAERLEGTIRRALPSEPLVRAQQHAKTGQIPEGVDGYEATAALREY